MLSTVRGAIEMPSATTVPATAAKSEIRPPTPRPWVDGRRIRKSQQISRLNAVLSSWWPKWSDWLERQAGRKIAAPRSLGNRKYRRIEPAPGHYVMTKTD